MRSDLALRSRFSGLNKRQFCMDAFIEWNKCRAGTWCHLSELDLDHEHFSDMEGVYVIWYGEQNPRALRVGQGLIKDCLASERHSKDIMAYKQVELYVTWARVGKLYRSGVVRHLVERLKPRFENTYPDDEPINVNLPWHKESFPWE